MRQDKQMGIVIQFREKIKYDQNLLIPTYADYFGFENVSFFSLHKNTRHTKLTWIMRPDGLQWPPMALHGPRIISWPHDTSVKVLIFWFLFHLVLFNF